jgi:hypothetical protein
MNKVNEVTVAMQKHCIPLSQCDSLIAHLSNSIKKYRDKGVTVKGQRNPFHKCPLEICKALSSYKKLCPDPNFVKGVIKIQSSDWNSLTEGEARACKHLLVENVNESLDEQETTDNESSSCASPIGMSRHIKKTQEQKTNHSLGLFKSTSPYVNCNFIYGSAAKVEWLWSIAKTILSSNRASMSPLVFESLLFLRVNRRFWDIKTVTEAYANARSNAKSDRLSQKIADERVMEEFVETNNGVSDEEED